MSTTDPVTDYIRTVLRGSGTPVTERPDVAAEMRAHIDALVQRQRLDGQAEDAAVAGALREFGDPDVLRRELRRQQMRALRRRRLAEFRPPVAVVAVVTAGLTIWLAAHTTGTVLQRVWAGLAFYVALEVASTALGLLIIWCVPPFELSVPRSELALGRRIVGWLATYLVGLVGIVIMTAALIVVVSTIWKPPAFHPSDPYYLLRAIQQGTHILLTQWLGLAGLAFLALGTAVVQYLRSPDEDAVEITR